jgi:hypothetical protein
VASTTNNGKRENDGDSGKKLEICDRVWQIVQMLMLRDQRQSNITDLSVTSVRDLLRARKGITAPFELCSLVVFVGHYG